MWHDFNIGFTKILATRSEKEKDQMREQGPGEIFVSTKINRNVEIKNKAQEEKKREREKKNARRREGEEWLLNLSLIRRR